MERNDRRPATRQSWPNLQPFPDKHTPLVIQRAFSEDEYERIAWGFIPQAMEDKWFIFLETDVLRFHRSWTGSCVYQLTLKKDGTRYTIQHAAVSRDPDQYGASDHNDDQSLLLSLIDDLLLGRRSQRPGPTALTTGTATAASQPPVAEKVQADEERPKQRKKRGWLWRWLTGG